MIVYISAGSNLQNKEDNLKKAISYLSNIDGIKFLRCSDFYETSPWGFLDQPNFVNAVFELETDLSPDDLLEKCKNIETKVGRKETSRKWQPRIIDLDIIFYGNIIYENNGLVIPHKHCHKRNFVLEPMMELNENFVHPVLKLTVKELWNRLNKELAAT